jgi:hypothetical protein
VWCGRGVCGVCVWYVYTCMCVAGRRIQCVVFEGVLYAVWGVCGVYIEQGQGGRGQADFSQEVLSMMECMCPEQPECSTCRQSLAPPRPLQDESQHTLPFHRKLYPLVLQKTHGSSTPSPCLPPQYPGITAQAVPFLLQTQAPPAAQTCLDPSSHPRCPSMDSQLPSPLYLHTSSLLFTALF